MSCYNPIMAWPDDHLKTKNGKPYLHFAGNFDGKDDSFEMIKQGTMITIPCGKCIGCKLDYARNWADRMMLEFEACRKAVFVTLTYDESNIPKLYIIDENGEVFDNYFLDKLGYRVSPLVRSHVSQFMKSLRSKFLDNGYDIRIRFFACGEYGEKKHRPHYHIILFGVDLQDLCITFSGDKQGYLKDWIRNELGQVSYRSNLLEDVWKKGIVTVSEASYETMGYVARYSLKKAKGSKYPEIFNLPPEFTLMSRNPGIGQPFLDANPGLIDEVSDYYIRGKSIFWPKYLLEKEHMIKKELVNFKGEVYYEYEPDETLKRLKEERRKLAVDKFISTFQNDERPYYEKQLFLERQKTSATEKLQRGDVDMI